MEDITRSKAIFLFIGFAGPAVFFSHTFLNLSEGGLFKLLGISSIAFVPSLYFLYTPIFKAVKSPSDISVATPSSDTSGGIVFIVFSLCFVVVSGSNWVFAEDQELEGVILAIDKTGMRHMCGGELMDLGVKTVFCIPQEHAYHLDKHDPITVHYREGIFGPSYVVDVERG